MKDDMRKIGVVICNYNKRDYVLNCIASMLKQSVEADIYVVDNASADGSAEAVRQKYGQQVTLIENKDNLGGSGGFNTGLRRVLQEDYTYIMLMDNDVVADVDAVKHLYEFLEEHPDVGMAGSKVYYMDDPDKIWGYGADIDFEKYVQKDKYKNWTDSPEIPEISYCEYVAACSLMARTDAIRKVGIMPEENFIYWDDMEWGYRFNRAGYKVCVYGKSKVWHKGGGSNAVNTFSNYYMLRNRILFFKKVLPAEKREHFADLILDYLFRMIYSCHLKGEDNIVKSVMYAFDDAVHGVTGKAEDRKILPRGRNAVRIAQAIGEAANVLVRFNGDHEGLGNIIRNIKKNKPDVQIGIAVESGSGADPDSMAEQYPDCRIETVFRPEKYGSHMIMCEHIFKITPDMPRDVYVDSYCNIIFTDDDFTYASGFEQTKELFTICRKDLLLASFEA